MSGFTYFLGSNNKICLSINEISACVGVNNSNPLYNLDVLGNANVSSNLYVNGQGTLSNLLVSQNMIVNDNVGIYGSATISNLIVASNLTVDNNIIANNNLTLTNNFICNGVATMSNIDILNIQNNTVYINTNVSGPGTLYLLDIANAAWNISSAGYKFGFYNNNGGTYNLKAYIDNNGNFDANTLSCNGVTLGVGTSGYISCGQLTTNGNSLTCGTLNCSNISSTASINCISYTSTGITMSNGAISSGAITTNGNSITATGGIYGNNFSNVGNVTYSFSNQSLYANTTDLTASLALINQINVIGTISNNYNSLVSGGVASNACLVISGHDNTHNGYSFSQYFYAGGTSFQGNNSSSWSVTSSSKIKKI
jgi:hypothetical protein